MSTATASTLDIFHPLIRRWFDQAVGEPTDVQAQAWPRIAAGEHVLISAPTGSGKTLTAFLWALDRLLTGRWEPGRVRVLYVSPLKALNTDIRRNLKRPLEELSERFRAAGEEAPGIRVLTRSGDTKPAERQRMLRRPPEILITTPESLNILLTSKGGRSLLESLESVILDEIHAVAASKRGTHLITAVDRLVPLSGEFQRVALSATIKPMDVIADFVGGWRLRRTEGGVAYVKRRVSRVRSTTQKRYHVEVRTVSTGAPSAQPAEAQASAELEDDSLWQLLAEDFHRRVRRNRSTLLFANSRRMTERVTRLINDLGAETVAYSHHGSLSREVRTVVEKRLKEGELKAIVATNSLELGIDVGALDEVVLIQTPRSISSAIQRVGRAGHGVGEVSRGVFYPTHGRDFLDAAVVARSILDQDIESVRPIVSPLDVLAQVMLSMVVAETWNLDDLYARLRASWPYRDLKRRQFDLVVDMLTGRYADSRIRELKPRASLDRIDQTLKARPGVARILYMSGGTIADRGYFALRVQDSMAKLGELDEEFVWERSPGDSFTLGAQSWQIRKITHNDVLVEPARRGSTMAPFWRADAQDRDFFLSQKIARLLARFEDRLEDPELVAVLERDYRFERAAADELLDFLRSQKAATGVLPNHRRLLIEHSSSSPGDDGRDQVIFHTFWGGTVNRPLAIALQAAWEERYPEPFEAFHDDDCLLLRLPRDFDAREVLSLVDPDQVETLLRRRLEGTGFFGARFRVGASTALLLPRTGFRHRTPLWMHRQRSKKLLEAALPYGDFPILVEAWRTCLRDELDLDSLKEMLGKVEAGEVAVEEVRTLSPSPFAASLMWRHTNHYMYADDSPEATGPSGLRPDLLRELVFEAHLRPRLPPELIEQFRGKVQRTAAGYAPRPGDDLVDWLRERILIPDREWRQLLDAVVRDHDEDEARVLATVARRAAWLELPGAASGAACALDSVPRILRALGLELTDVALTGVAGERLADEEESGLRRLWSATEPRAEGDDAERWDLLAGLAGEWLVFEGPVEPRRLGEVFGLGEAPAAELLSVLRESQRVVVDQLTRGAEVLEVCDTDNLETLLRWLRVSRRPSFEALAAAALPLFLAAHQGLAERGDGLEDLQDRLEKLFGYPAPAASWERDFLPARLAPYYPSWLDSLMQGSDLAWVGCGDGRLTFAFPSDVELFAEPDDGPAAGADDGAGDEAVRDVAILDALFPDRRGKADLAELAERSGRPAAAVSDELWRLAWRGRVTNDSYVAVRKGVENRFQPTEPPRRPASARRRPGAGRWRASRPGYGSWTAVETPPPPGDAVEADELAKDRVRVLLQRFGLLFRDLLRRELPLLRWPRVFRALRLMELSGEVHAGHFFAGVAGLQFISHAAFRQLRRGLPEDAIFWLSAADPASLAGVDVEGLKGTLPSRLASNHLVYHGRRLVLTSKRRGRHLEIHVDPDHPRLGDYLEVLKVQLTREVQPLSAVEIETIGGEPAGRSPYCDPLSKIFRLTREPRSIKLWKRYR